jgi:hypothetical protein
MMNDGHHHHHHHQTSPCDLSDFQSAVSGSQASPPATKRGRGRKRDDTLPYNRARDVQRAFRARRTAHLEALEERVQDLEEENSRLRAELHLPQANRPPLGKGPTGRGGLLVGSSTSPSTTTTNLYHSPAATHRSLASCIPLDAASPINTASPQSSSESPPSETKSLWPSWDSPVENDLSSQTSLLGLERHPPQQDSPTLSPQGAIPTSHFGPSHYPHQAAMQQHRMSRPHLQSHYSSPNYTLHSPQEQETSRSEYLAADHSLPARTGVHSHSFPYSGNHPENQYTTTILEQHQHQHLHTNGQQTTRFNVFPKRETIDESISLTGLTAPGGDYAQEFHPQKPHSTGSLSHDIQYLATSMSGPTTSSLARGHVPSYSRLPAPTIAGTASVVQGMRPSPQFHFT